MAKPNDNIINSTNFHGGIIASALADLQKYDNVSSSGKIGTNSISQFRTNPIPEFTTPQLTSVDNSPLSTYHGIIGTALRNEISTTANGYIPSQYEQQTFTTTIDTSINLPLEKLLSKESISLNDQKSITYSFDHTLSTNDSILQSPRYTGRHKGNEKGMINKWLQEIAESKSSNLNNRKEIANVLISPRTGILGLLLKKKKKSRNLQTSQSVNSLSSNSDYTLSDTNSIMKESWITRRNRLLSNSKTHEQNYNKQLALDDFDNTIIDQTSQQSKQNIFAEKDKSREDQRIDYTKWSIQYSTSKESKSSTTTSIGLLVDEDEYNKNISSKV
uniref:Uncharacterized protein n=1 Tax=Loa loa TaxID=7209 RepID=A0A1I7V887_LOALO